MSRRRRKAREKMMYIVQIYAESEWDKYLHRELFGIKKCFKCGSEEFDEILDENEGVVYCCSDCIDYERHN